MYEGICPKKSNSIYAEIQPHSVLSGLLGCYRQPPSQNSSTR